MKVSYDIDNEINSFKIKEKDISNLNFLLTNNKGDFLNIGIEKNSTKFQGLNVCNPKTLEVFKFIDEITLADLEVDEVKYDGFTVQRHFKSKNILSENPTTIDNKTFDTFYLGPTGGMIYEINNYEGKVFIDLDVRKQFDFDKWGRNYTVYKGKGIVFVKYQKEGDDSYEVFLGIKASNFSYDLIEEWAKKDYSYCKKRNSFSDTYVYKLMNVDILDNKRLIIGAGFSEDEVLSQIDLLEKHNEELQDFDRNLLRDLMEDLSFEKPVSQDLILSYKLSINSMYNFWNKNLDSGEISEGIFAGFPWFSKVWTRDELICSRAFINMSEFTFFKERFYYYLDNINIKTGLFKRISEEGSLESVDGIFWLGKRFLDLIHKVEKDNKFKEIFNWSEMTYVYERFNLCFNKIIENQWDKDKELLKVKQGDSWMDTIPVEFPLDIQVQFLEFISGLGFLAGILGKKDEAKHFLDFENGFREKIRESYFRNGLLYDEPNDDKISCNIFLAYYFYPELFLQKDWELIFDKSLLKLRTSWGGISTLSKRDKRFQDEYLGEKNESYHQGDSWFWINNVAAIVLDDLNERKYRNEIKKILTSSVEDILRKGCVGYSSELSSAKEQRSEGCFAQAWSSATFVEMCDKIFRKN